ncbi:MAG: tetratricopeptide repeat protein [Phycisphaerae bacterium]|nr:tetratricopeptide repeat protein [Phycisphaerae bacterium]
MAANSQGLGHESYMKLAEAGRHQEALEQVRAYLREHPQDFQAWNDCGAILYCLRQVEDAIAAFEKARNLSGSSVSAEIIWNLCEAYLDGGYPGMAVQQFDIMETRGLLSADLLNRAADAFLQQESYGGAIEMLLRSLDMTPKQEILQPMLEILRTKRPRLAVFAASEDDQTRTVVGYAQKRFQTELHVGRRVDEIRSILERNPIAWFEGCDGIIEAVSQMPKVCSLVLRFRPGDISQSRIDQIRWEQINTVIVTGLKAEYEALLEQVEGIEGKTRVVFIPEGVDCREYGFISKQRGKNLAYVGPLTAEANPMFLLQCMQKLNYLDPSYRLYLVGFRTDRRTESYLRHMIDQMRLSGVVMMDSMPRNLNVWLRDKSYIVAAGIQGQGWEGVLKGMAAGLRPVVANFPGVEERLDHEFVFDLAEDFCRQIQSGSFEPQRYRDLAESKFSLRTMFRAWNDELYRLEKAQDQSNPKPDLQNTAPPLLTAERRNEILFPDPARTSTPITEFHPIPGGPTVVPFQPGNSTFPKPDLPINSEIPPFYPLPSNPSISSTAPIESPAGFYPSNQSGFRPADPPSEVIPITPIQPVNLNQSPNALQEPMPVWNPSPVQPTVSGQPAHVAVRKQRSVEELAKEALKASQALAELAKQKSPVMNTSTGIPESIRPGTVAGNPFGLFQETARESQLARAASEFSDRPISLDIPGFTNGEPTAPFYRTQGQ